MSDSDLAQMGLTGPESAPDPGLESPKQESKKPKRPKKKSMFRDPVVRGLALVAAGLVVLYLVLIVSAMMTGVLGTTEPRTKLERDLQYYEQMAMRTPTNVNVWASYIGALIDSRQYGKAQDVIDQASKAIDQKPTQGILMTQARLYFATKQYKKAMTVCDEVRKKLKTYNALAKKQKGSPESMGREIDFNYWNALLLKGESLALLNRKAEAVKCFDEYLKANTADADVFDRRGSLKLELGDKKGAKADFEYVLKYLPGDKVATEGLKKIGAK